MHKKDEGEPEKVVSYGGEKARRDTNHQTAPQSAIATAAVGDSQGGQREQRWQENE